MAPRDATRRRVSRLHKLGALCNKKGAQFGHTSHEEEEIEEEISRGCMRRQFSSAQLSAASLSSLGGSEQGKCNRGERQKGGKVDWHFLDHIKQGSLKGRLTLIS